MTFGTLIANTLPTTLSNSRNKRTNSFINIIHYPPMANEKEQGQQLQIELTPEIANGTYSNLAIINHSPQEFVLDFIAALPRSAPGSCQCAPNPHSRERKASSLRPPRQRGEVRK